MCRRPYLDLGIQYYYIYPQDVSILPLLKHPFHYLKHLLSDLICIPEVYAPAIKITSHKDHIRLYVYLLLSLYNLCVCPDTVLFEHCCQLTISNCIFSEWWTAVCDTYIQKTHRCQAECQWVETRKIAFILNVSILTWWRSIQIATLSE